MDNNHLWTSTFNWRRPSMDSSYYGRGPLTKGQPVLVTKLSLEVFSLEKLWALDYVLVSTPLWIQLSVAVRGGEWDGIP